jgi:pyruvate/2-oxoacid:ferredoxin oxidoreductase beta subunit/Pyruvate/2-oxoacid:ferredoxin oxidoreductase delta subunit
MVDAQPAPAPPPAADPLTKKPGEPKELHTARLGRALPVLDVAGYVADFGATVVPAYRAGLADRELPADAGVARSLIPPGTAATRDFSTLAPRIPAFDAEKCVGCMSCVNTCPDTAILATAQPAAQLAERIGEFAAGAEDPAALAAGLEARFADTQKYGVVPARRGLEPARFGIFVDPAHCKGCAECVEVCHALGYDALAMMDKQPATADRPGTVAELGQQMRFYRSLPPTPVEYRNEKALADLMLGEHALGYVGGAGSCSGCGEATALRMLVAATRQVHGAESMGIVAATGCNTVYGSTYPFNPYLVPWTNSLFENAPADALGIRARWDQAGHRQRRLWVVGGDGAMYDIGFQSLSRMVASGADIKVLVLDTQVYSNTGGQASTASFGGQVTKLSAYGKVQHGRPERRKELAPIMIAHGEVYVAQTTAAHVNHFYRAVIEANEYPGPAVIVVYTPCQPEHGIADDAANAQSRLAVDSRAWPLLTYDPRRGPSIAERLSLQGNPALRADWLTTRNDAAVDFLTFARTEGRFAAHFASGEPSPEIRATAADRLANWRRLQEMAGLAPSQSAEGPKQT